MSAGHGLADAHCLATEWDAAHPREPSPPH
ncbi:uncharacterized protein METZ01_LOCUS167339 [marine metagenome]|uniref:Uncharacterized protein n=1 Tax=marine metagenome TaxID=408172 RepID=A0A382BL16_9ZZZZ